MRNTEEREINKSYVHCPHCDKKWFTTVSAVDLNYKCDKCHRRYLIFAVMRVIANGKSGKSKVKILGNNSTFGTFAIVCSFMQIGQN